MDFVNTVAWLSIKDFVRLSPAYKISLAAKVRSGSHHVMLRMTDQSLVTDAGMDIDGTQFYTVDDSFSDVSYIKPEEIEKLCFIDIR